MVSQKLDKLADQLSAVREQNARLTALLENSIKQFDEHVEEADEGWKRLEALELKHANWKGMFMAVSMVMGGSAVVIDYALRIWLKV